MNVRINWDYSHSCVRDSSYSWTHLPQPSYLSSWCSGSPAAAGCAAGEAGRSVWVEGSAALEDCCCSSHCHSCRGTRHHRGSPAVLGPRRWRDSRPRRISDGQYCGGPRDSPYWNRNRHTPELIKSQVQQFQSDLLRADTRVCISGSEQECWLGYLYRDLNCLGAGFYPWFFFTLQVYLAVFHPFRSDLSLYTLPSLWTRRYVGDSGLHLPDSHWDLTHAHTHTNAHTLAHRVSAAVR